MVHLVPYGQKLIDSVSGIRSETFPSLCGTPMQTYSDCHIRSPLSAIINTKNILIRYKCRVIIVHVKIIVCNNHTGKNIIRCNSSFSCFIFEMKHMTIIFIPVIFLIHSIHFIYTSRKCSFINSRNSASAVQNTL